MKRNAIAGFAILFAVASGSLSSCSWKKSPAPADQSVTAGTQQESGPDYRSGATVVEDEGSGGLEGGKVSSGSVLSLGAAINSEKIQACDKLGSETDAQSCKDMVFFKTATESHDYETCDKISRPRNRQICSNRVSQYLSNFGDCEKIRDEEVKKACVTKSSAVETKMVQETAASLKKTQETLAKAATAGTPEARVNAACSGVSGTNRNYCYSVRVSEEIQKGAPATLCSVIPDAATKSACEQKASGTSNKAILDEAIASKNPAVCDKLSIQQDKDLCKKIVAG